MTPIRALILLIGLGMTTGALAEMRTYDVDARYRQEVYAALRGVLSAEGAKSPDGVQLLPTGQLLVNASAETQEQVAAVLESIRNHQVEATPRVTIKYGAVLGTQGSPQNPGMAAGKEVPAILSDVLDGLRRVHGNLAFSLYGQPLRPTETRIAIDDMQVAVVELPSTNSKVRIYQVNNN